MEEQRSRRNIKYQNGNKWKTEKFNETKNWIKNVNKTDKISSKKKKTQITNISKKNGNLTRGSTNAEKDKKQQELPVTAGGSAQCYSHSGSQFGGFLQN